MDDTGLADSDKLQIVGLLSSYTLSEGRMATDAMRAAEAAITAEPGEPGGPSEPGGAAVEAPHSYEALLRELVDEQTYPRLHRLAWSPEPDTPPAEREREQFLFGVDTILDGVQALIDRTTG